MRNNDKTKTLYIQNKEISGIVLSARARKDYKHGKSEKGKTFSR